MKIIIPIVETENRNTQPPSCKNLYEINRKTILQHICENLQSIKDAQFIFIINKNDADKYHLDYVIKLLVPDAEIVIANGKTKGSACSCLLAIDYFDMDEPVVIVGGDQLIAMNLQEIVDYFICENFDGGIVTFEDVHPRWSYVRIDQCGLVVEAAEKRPISKNAASGFYYFKRTGDFVDSAFSMIKKEANVDGDYYVCPSYNEMILKQKKISTYKIDKNLYFNFNHIKGIELFEEFCKKNENM